MKMMEKLTEEPEFVFYHNPIKDVVDRGYGITGGDDRIEEFVKGCFRQVPGEEIPDLKLGGKIYVNREMYGDVRVFEPKELINYAGYGPLTGMMRGFISRITELGIEYETKGNCKSLIRTDIGTPDTIFDSPDLEKISELVSRYGEGILVAPTREEVERFKRALNRDMKQGHFPWPDTYTAFTDCFGNFVRSAESLLNAGKYSVEDAERDKIRFIRGLEKAIRESSEDSRITKEGLMKAIALARGSWMNMKTLQRVIDYYSEVRDR